MIDWNWFWLIVAAVAGYEWYFFHYLASRAEMTADLGDRAAAVEDMEALCRLPTVGGKFFARCRLAEQYFLIGQFRDAVDQYRILLQFPLSDNREADLRMKLSECLEAAGDEEEAAAQRARVAALTGDCPIDSIAALTRGRLLEREGRFEEACEVYKVGTRHVPDHMPDLQNDFLLRLSSAALKAGMVQKAMEWADEAVENGARGKTLAGLRMVIEKAQMHVSDPIETSHTSS